MKKENESVLMASERDKQIEKMPKEVNPEDASVKAFLEIQKAKTRFFVNIRNRQPK